MGLFGICESCRRHVRVVDAQCPFCGASNVPASGGRVPVRGFAAAAVTAVALAGCGPRPEPAYGIPQDAINMQDSVTDPDAQADTRPQPAYGIAQDVVAPDAADAADVPEDMRAQPAYGIPQDF